MGPILSCRSCGTTQQTSGNKWWSCRVCSLRQTAPRPSSERLIHALHTLTIIMMLGIMMLVAYIETSRAYRADQQFRDRYIQWEQSR